MDDKTQQQIDELEVQVNKILTSVQKTERYMKITFWSTVILLLLPMLIAAVIVPVVVGKYVSMYEGLL
jgi:hypothetical protein